MISFAGATDFTRPAICPDMKVPSSTLPSWTAFRREPAVRSSNSSREIFSFSIFTRDRVNFVFKLRMGAPPARPVTMVSVSFASITICLYFAWQGLSSAHTKMVPHCTAWAPKAKAAATPLASAMPPAAMTGIETASTTWGTRHMVVVSPI